MDVNQKRLSHYQQLFIYGDFIPLKFKIDLDLYTKEITQFNNSWVVYNQRLGDTGRMGLSITSLDGGMTGNPDLQSLYQYSKETGQNISENQFCVPTDAYKKLSSLNETLSAFNGGLGRCRLVKFRKGGFFPPHRDQSISYNVPDYFRIFVPLVNTGNNNLYFIYNDQKIAYEPGRAYLFNALKTHSVFSFVDEAHTFALSLQLNESNIKCALDCLDVN